jgi:hypothetical protein
MKKHTWVLSLLLTLFWTIPAMAIEEPKYKILRTDEDIEVRQYEPQLIAQTVVDGDMDQASNKGFRLIADFIFGNNEAPNSSGSAKIAMTAPVVVEPQKNASAMQDASQWRINFVMPSQYNLGNIPKPKNSAVELKQIPSKVFVVLSYSGFNFTSKVEQKTQDALNWSQQHGYKIIGTPQLARYDPPWTLPMFRRNEIMIEIAGDTTP